MPYIGNTAANRFVASKAATQFSGDGSNTVFTLDHSVASDEDILVSVDGVIQEPSVAYAVSNGTTLTFTAAPSSNSGNNIFVYYLFRTVGTVGHPSNQALTATTGTFTGNIIIPNAGNIGSASDTDAIAISSGGVVNFTQTPTVNSISVTNAPAFEAKLSSNQSFSDNTSTKVTFDTEEFDEGGCYDHSTNYRFTPNVAGKYHVYLSMCVNSAGDAQLANSYAMIYRNGTKTKTSHQNHASANDRASTVTIMSTLTFNGSSDYVEAYVQAADSSGNAEVLSADFSVFGAYKLIGMT